MAIIAPLVTQPKSHEWETPPEFFDALEAEFHFGVDVAASSENTKCLRYFDHFGLDLSWSGFGTVWCNPPYGSGIGKWVSKGYRESVAGTTVVMLIPARTDTAYWHDCVMRAAEIRLVRGRLVFGGVNPNSNSHGFNAPFPSAVVVFRPGEHKPIFSTIGRNGRP